MCVLVNIPYFNAFSEVSECGKAKFVQEKNRYFGVTHCLIELIMMNQMLSNKFRIIWHSESSYSSRHNFCWRPENFAS